MATFTNRKRFSTREIGEIRKKFKELAIRAYLSDIKFEMNVDGHNIGKVNYGHETFFRFSTPSYAVEIVPMYVRHKKNEPAIGLHIYSYGPDSERILYHKIATAQRTPALVLDDAYTIVTTLEQLKNSQEQS